MKIEDLMQVLPENYTPSERELIMRAYIMAEEAHRLQARASGEPYINHCISVAIILAEMDVPAEAVAAGLLHDTVEDTTITLDDLRREFGDDLTKLVDGVTKLTQLPRVSRADGSPREDEQLEMARQIAERRGLPDPDQEHEKALRSRKHELVQETLRKTFIAMGDDVRIVLIKLADRLHNMRTLSHLPEHKRHRIAQETLEIFAPLANRLGIWQMKWELEDLGFRYTNPDKYREIARNLADRRNNREREMAEIIANLTTFSHQSGINAEITGRPKHIYSIYKKMVRKGVPFDMVHDVRGVRILVPDIPSCYAMLGVIHTHWPPIPGQFDDYIAVPKDNYYRSLHTAVVYDDGKTLEVQIRTPEMHQDAELGIAAHWRYKEDLRREEAFERRILWFRSLMDWREDVKNASEFINSLKTDVFDDRVYVFTPKGDVIDLPVGSTPVDFAYHVHTDVGNCCRGAKVNGKLVTLDYHLRTGDQVEILTSKRGGPSRDWLNPNLGIVKTQRARSKIKHWFLKQARDKNLTQGRDLLDKELHRLGLVDVNLENLARKLGYRATEDLVLAIGTEDVPMARVAAAIMEGEKDDEGVIFGERTSEPGIQSHEDIAVVGLKGLLTTIARCCKPAPGDLIVGYITRGRGATIHRADCPNVLRLSERERIVRVSWGASKRTYPVSVRIKAYDRDGLMRDVANLVTDEGINMGSVKVAVDHTNKYNMADFQLILEVRDVEQLARILNRIEALPNVLEATRMRPG